MTESDLRRLLNALEAYRASLHGWLHFWTFLVVVGVALEVVSLTWEYLKELNDFKRGEIHATEKPSLLLFAVGFMGIALVVAGVSGELYIDVKAETIETGIRKANDDLLALISKEAGDAKKSASDAADAAARAKIAADGAESKAEAVGKEADLAREKIAAVGKRAEVLEYVLSARRIQDEDGLENDLRKEFKGKHIAFDSYVGDEEAYWLCSQLANIARKAGVDAEDECATKQMLRLPITDLHIDAPTLDEAERLSRVLKKPGRVPGIFVGFNLGAQEEIVTVGVKPSVPLLTKPKKVSSPRPNSNSNTRP